MLLGITLISKVSPLGSIAPSPSHKVGTTASPFQWMPISFLIQRLNPEELAQNLRDKNNASVAHQNANLIHTDSHYDPHCFHSKTFTLRWSTVSSHMPGLRRDRSVSRSATEDCEWAGHVEQQRRWHHWPWPPTGASRKVGVCACKTEKGAARARVHGPARSLPSFDATHKDPLTERAHTRDSPRNHSANPQGSPANEAAQPPRATARATEAAGTQRSRLHSQL